MFESNLANLTAQYQQAYLAYCYKIMQYLSLLAWMEQQRPPKHKVKPKSTSGIKKVNQEPNQQNHDFKSLMHQGKIKPNKKLTSESLQEGLSEGTFGGNGLGILSSPQQPGVWDAIGGTASGMFGNMGNDLLNSVDSFNNTFIFPATDKLGAADILDPAFNTAALWSMGQRCNRCWNACWQS